MTGRWRVRSADRPTRRETGVSEAVTDEVSPLSPVPARRQRPPNTPAASAATYPLRCFAPQWARFDNRQKRPAHQPLPSHRISGSGARGTSDPLNRHRHPQYPVREYTLPNLHDPQRAKGALDRRSKRLSFPHFFLRRKKCGRRRPPPRQGGNRLAAGAAKLPSRPEARNLPAPAGAKSA